MSGGISSRLSREPATASSPIPGADSAGLARSIRHSPVDTLALLPWAREEVFSFVLFYRQGLDQQAQRVVGEWTRELVEATLKHEGRYYLPYQLHATKEQFERAYPEVAQLRQLKSRVDPQGRFSNSLWQKYL